MLDGVMLIIVTMFAVLGAYYLSEVIAELCTRKKLHDAVLVTVCTDEKSFCETVLAAQKCAPHCEVVAICRAGAAPCEGITANARGVHFATSETAGDIICGILAVKK